MPKKRLFSDWLIEKHKIRVRDLSQISMPRFWKKFTDVGAVAIKKKYIYIRGLRKVEERKLVEVLMHELRHIHRQRKLGWTVFLIKYALSKKFRTGEEINAYLRTMETRLLFGNTFPGMPGRYAKLIHDMYYVGSAQYQRARDTLTRKYNLIEAGTIRTVRDEWHEYQYETNRS